MHSVQPLCAANTALDFQQYYGVPRRWLVLYAGALSLDVAISVVLAFTTETDRLKLAAGLTAAASFLILILAASCFRCPGCTVLTEIHNGTHGGHGFPQPSDTECRSTMMLIRRLLLRTTPAAFILPLLLLYELISTPQTPFGNSIHPFMSLARVVGYLGTLLPGGLWGGAASGPPRIFCEGALKKILSDIQEREHVQWDHMTAEVQKKQKLIDRIYGPRNVGGQVLAGFTACVCHMILGALFVIGYPDLHVLGGVMFFGNGICLFAYLFFLSSLTSLLVGRMPAAAFEKGCTLADNADEMGAHSRFMFYLMNAQLGVRFFGISLTRSTVVRYFVKVVVVLPSVYKLLKLWMHCGFWQHLSEQ
mmetsp:Transcript_91252/g.181422  ORF Transcript_91252/g.181422 Transcript_91252/m.181422 type:complete len:363 (-) Transcript_91252:85-1173(-)